jgi:allantoin racemase
VPAVVRRRGADESTLKQVDMPTILLINPNTSRETMSMMHRILREALPPSIEVISESAARGASMITTESDLAIAAQEVRRIGRARAHEVSAIVVGAFGDPGLDALSSEVSVPVIGIGEASLREAAAGGRPFGVATTTPGLGDSIARAVEKLGLAQQFTGTRITEGNPLELAAAPDLQDEKLAQAVQACIEDGAAVVLIGGGPLSDAATRLATRFDIPIVSAAAAAARRVQRLLAGRMANP